MKKERIDIVLVKKAFFETREKAKRAILEGKVLVESQVATKARMLISPDSKIEVKPDLPYVSRGGIKLEKALRKFKVKVEGKTCLDVGSSTGGFVDCLLKFGAKRVIAVDVGYGQLAWSLRNDPRVFLLERTNVRYLEPSKLPERADLATVDLSFISVRKVFSNLIRLLKKKARIIILVKPQFEAGKEQVGKGGVVKDPQVHEEVLYSLSQFFSSQGFGVNLTYSPICGSDGNIEFLMMLSPKREKGEFPNQDFIKNLVKEAHQTLKGKKNEENSCHSSSRKR